MTHVFSKYCMCDSCMKLQELYEEIITKYE